MTGTAVETAGALDYRETADTLAGFFAWKPGPLAAAAVRALSRVTRPLEQGAYAGPPLAGEPHRAAWVIASPLTVFVLAERGWRRKCYLAARLRSAGPVNIIQAAGGKSSERSGLERDLGALLTVQRESEVSLTVVPVVRAHHQHTPDAPGETLAARAYRFSPMKLFRKATNWARTARTGAVKNCRPFVLSRWMERDTSEDLASQVQALRLELSGNQESERRACTGPPLTPRWEVRRKVLADPVLAAYMNQHAVSEGKTREAVIDEARRHFDEIASDYRTGVVRYFVRAVDFAFARLLDGLEVDREGIRFLSECDSRSRIVLVCSHKSYVDPLLIGYTMFRSGLVPPQQAAGLNLDIFFLGWLLRHSGAFYLRRTFAGETLYREVFKAYVRHLLAENYTSVVYIEGTRSRDGKMLKPKTGYLSILEDCLRTGVCPDITLVPVYLGYDKVPEEAAHVREMAGGGKVSEGFKGFAGIYKSINTRLGRAFVKFGAPVGMRALLEERGLEGVAEAVCDGIEAVTPVTARSLAASALLSSGGTAVSALDFEAAGRALLTFSERRGLPLAANADMEGLRAAVDWFEREARLTVESDGTGKVYRLEGAARRHLEYNKNIPLGHYLLPAMAAAASRSGEGGSTGAGVDFLRLLFSREFVFRPSGAGEAWKLDYSTCPGELAGLLEPFLESYLVACRAAGLPGEEGVTLENLVESCFAEGSGMLASGEIRREESLSRVAFRNALKSFVDMGLLTERRESDGNREKVRLFPGPSAGERPLVEERIRSFL